MGSPAIPPARRIAAFIVAARAARAALVAAAVALGAAAVTVLGAAPAACASVPSDSAAIALPDSTHLRPTAPPAVRRAADWETLNAGLPEEARLRPVVRFRYNRVDGPTPTLGAAFVTARAPAPVLFAEATYAFSRDRLLYEAGLTEPIGEPERVRAGGSVYRRTATEDGWIVGEGENTLFALLARTDYRDYYETSGIQGFIGWTPGQDFGLRVDARTESEHSLRVRTRVSAFGKHDTFRPNPPIERGQDRAYAITMRVGPETLPTRGGTSGEATWERSGEPMTSDFDYGRLRGAVRTRIRLAPGQEIRARILGGFTLLGALPVQKVWDLGGIGTLRGHDFKVFSGDQFLLGNAECYLLARRNLYAFTFLDCGAAWFGEGNWDRQKPALDAGLGIRISEGPAAITVGKNLRDSDAPLKVGVRLGGAF